MPYGYHYPYYSKPRKTKKNQEKAKKLPEPEIEYIPYAWYPFGFIKITKPPLTQIPLGVQKVAFSPWAPQQWRQQITEQAKKKLKEKKHETSIHSTTETLEEKRKKIAETLHIEPEAIELSIYPKNRIIAKIHYYKTAKNLDDIMNDARSLEELGFYLFEIIVDKKNCLTLKAVGKIPPKGTEPAIEVRLAPERHIMIPTPPFIREVHDILLNKVVRKGMKIRVPGIDIAFIITRTVPEGDVMVTKSTQVIVERHL